MKKIFAIFAALVMTVMATAQPNNYEYPGHLGMPYVAIDGGVVAPLNTLTTFQGIQPTAGIELGTYVTPVWGASLQGIATYDKQGWNNFLGQTYVFGNGKMNVSNFLAGYKGYPRRVEFVLVAGAGWAHEFRGVDTAEPAADGSWIRTKADGDDTGATEPETPDTPAPDAEPAIGGPVNWMAYNTGAEINVNLGKERAWQVNVRPSVIWNHPDGGFGFDVDNAKARLTVGVTYKFGNRRIKSHNFVKNDYAVTQYDYDILMAKYEECHNRPAEVKEVPVETIVEKTVTVNVPTYFGETYILFPCGSSKLDAAAKATLDEFVKNAQDDVYVQVVGSADSKTGSETFNYDLAGKRAMAVKDYLVSAGLQADDIVPETTLDATNNVKTSRSAVLTIVVKE